MEIAGWLIAAVALAVVAYVVYAIGSAVLLYVRSR